MKVSLCDLEVQGLSTDVFPSSLGHRGLLRAGAAVTRALRALRRMASFRDGLRTEPGLAALNAYLSGRSYLCAASGVRPQKISFSQQAAADVWMERNWSDRGYPRHRCSSLRALLGLRCVKLLLLGCFSVFLRRFWDVVGVDGRDAAAHVFP